MATAADIDALELAARNAIVAGNTAAAISALERLVIAIGATPNTDAGDTRVMFQKLEWANDLLAALRKKLNTSTGIIRSKVTYVTTKD